VMAKLRTPWSTPMCLSLLHSNGSNTYILSYSQAIADAKRHQQNGNRRTDIHVQRKISL
jgi:hypothetical protein